MTASQDYMIRLYDTRHGGFTHKQSIEAREVGWSILDVAVSHAGDSLVYSSWCENLHSVSLTDQALLHILTTIDAPEKNTKDLRN